MDEKETELSPICEALKKFYDCHLLHSRVPKSVDPETGEITFKCKEGCDG